ncbi:hypothetical protein G6F50_016970 [Rhizopus delemar]|uniref:Secreted protein n=1 Tax=Rhizopus delemar TaxID=936053 RepID=A0A9P6XRZ4_9FUNG|nr:hypothetical protein G6F50_016970 [Rhizopus delemar]
MVAWWAAAAVPAAVWASWSCCCSLPMAAADASVHSTGRPSTTTMRVCWLLMWFSCGWGWALGSGAPGVRPSPMRNWEPARPRRHMARWLLRMLICLAW